MGCSFPEPPAWGWLEQDDWDFNTVTVHCNHSEASWKLLCNGNKWTAEGTVAKCPKGERAREIEKHQQTNRSILWEQLVLGLGFPIVVGDHYFCLP